MDRTATNHPATAREIILEIVRNMREGLEPLHYSTLPPAVYHVYLHPEDMERLRGILPRIVDEARRALDSELESLNRYRENCVVCHDNDRAQSKKPGPSFYQLFKPDKDAARQHEGER